MYTTFAHAGHVHGARSSVNNTTAEAGPNLLVMGGICLIIAILIATICIVIVSLTRRAKRNKSSKI